MVQLSELPANPALCGPEVAPGTRTAAGPWEVAEAGEGNGRVMGKRPAKSPGQQT